MGLANALGVGRRLSGPIIISVPDLALSPEDKRDELLGRTARTLEIWLGTTCLSGLGSLQAAAVGRLSHAEKQTIEISKPVSSPYSCTKILEDELVVFFL